MSVLAHWSSGAGAGAGTSPSVVISRQPLRAQSQAGEQRLAFCFVALLFWPLIAIPEIAVLWGYTASRGHQASAGLPGLLQLLAWTWELCVRCSFCGMATRDSVLGDPGGLLLVGCCFSRPCVGLCFPAHMVSHFPLRNLLFTEPSRGIVSI